MSLRTLIIDDEPLARQELQYLLERAGGVDVLAQGTNGIEAVELIRSHKGARNRLVELENCTDDELEELKKEFEKIREKSTRNVKGKADQVIATVEQEQVNREV